MRMEISIRFVVVSHTVQRLYHYCYIIIIGKSKCVCEFYANLYIIYFVYIHIYIYFFIEKISE